ncbi:hypothetical protein [Flaviaesturariibacter amylovorans]|uniref:Right-handed parallel beta-helix repeat-containing protein n=1 Tax=Flaviaesturariibacter amylovorans TaxID=1084520 RepID=A0ABP8HRA1_9BACT
MKQVLTFCLLAGAALFSQSANARVLRVGYQGPQVAGTDYQNLQSAVDAATANDTLQLYQNNYGGTATVTKRLVFVGFGYRLAQNPGLQAVPAAANTSTLSFRAGSENSVVQGISGNIYIAAENVTVSRCSGNVYLGYNTNAVHVPVTNVTVTASHIDLYGNYGAVSNAHISNCIINVNNLSNSAGLYTNNVMIGNNPVFGAFVVKNSIFTYNATWACPTGINAIFENNLFASSCTVTGANNQLNVPMANVFEDWNGFTNGGSESLLALKAGSPALGFGVSGTNTPTDAGIFGGDAGLVYKPGGIPAIPSIYQLSAPQLNATTNPYTITISVRSNN